MTLQHKGDDNGWARSAAQSPTRDITAADVRRIAAAGEIPEERLPELEGRLRLAVKLYYQYARAYDSCLTKKKNKRPLRRLS